MAFRATFLTVIVAACSPSSSAAPAADGTPDAATPEVADAGPPASDPNGWRKTGSMKVARAAHTATVLPDGRVLVVGGETIDRDMIASAEVFDPTTESWSEVEAPSTPRSNHVAVSLTDGRVLIAGGGRSAPIGQPSSTDVTTSAMLFDPSTKQFTATGSLLAARSHFRAVRLDDGEVLVVGGGGASTHSNCTGVPDCGPLADPLASVERFDPKTGVFKLAASMKHARYSFTLTTLSDGRVIAVGGVSMSGTKLASIRSAEIYDPKADSWTDAADLYAPDREHHSAILLDSGGLMVVGGKQANVGMIRLVEIYLPDANAWTKAASLSTVRTAPNLVRLASGHILAVGGFNQDTQTDVAESVIYAEPNGTWSKIGDLDDGRATHTTTLLSNGDVLVAGGFVQSTGSETKKCEMTKHP